MQKRDSRLVSTKGNDDSQDQLYSRYFAGNKSVQDLLTREIPVASDRGEILHLAYLSLIRTENRLRGNASLKKFVYRAVQIAILQKRRLIRSQERAPAARDIPDSSVNSSLALESLLNRLAEPLRIAFRLRVMEGLCHDEIARRTDAPLKTVATRIFQARKLLARVTGEPAPAANAA